ncbi:hypothetical protein SISNIDRAFT_470900 [Sistotremastrum niveocremeum HHB9708]|uniref:Uncharacterized protein n=1 Tax=Sistotremastrum niveocremeum HHB9708 TaxID=1314777 RepID=A0A164NBC6_9AGAM|nr:hypothetical protein SISNIDRAFT_470900 [Sistotremastrum niveocremeum HHB9708]
MASLYRAENQTLAIQTLFIRDERRQAGNGATRAPGSVGKQYDVGGPLPENDVNSLELADLNIGLDRSVFWCHTDIRRSHRDMKGKSERSRPAHYDRFLNRDRDRESQDRHLPIVHGKKSLNNRSGLQDVSAELEIFGGGRFRERPKYEDSQYSRDVRVSSASEVERGGRFRRDKTCQWSTSSLLHVLVSLFVVITTPCDLPEEFIPGPEINILNRRLPVGIGDWGFEVLLIVVVGLAVWGWELRFENYRSDDREKRVYLDIGDNRSSTIFNL